MPEIRGRKVHPWPGEPHMIQHSGQTFVSLGYVDDEASIFTFPDGPSRGQIVPGTGRLPVWPVDEIAARRHLSSPQIERLRRHNPNGVIEGELPAMWPFGNA